MFSLDSVLAYALALAIKTALLFVLLELLQGLDVLPNLAWYWSLLTGFAVACLGALVIIVIDET